MARVVVLLAAVCFGTTGTAQALGPDGTTPSAVGAARVLVGAALLWAYARWHAAARGGPTGAAEAVPGGSAEAVPAGSAEAVTAGPAEAVTAGSAEAVPAGSAEAVLAGRGWPHPAVVAAGAGIASYQLCFFAAVDSTGVAVGTVVALGSAPAFAGLLARVVSGEALRGRWAVATGLAALGVALLAGGGGGADVAVGGVLLALGAGASYAAYTVAAKRLLDAGHAPEAVMARCFGAGAVMLLPVLVAEGGGGLGSAGGLAMVLYLAAVPTALAYVLFARGLRALGAGETATLTLAEPVTAAALGIAVLGEPLTATAIAGGALVLGGLAVLAAPARSRPATDLAAAPEPAAAVSA